jgi:hypothetical protein
MHAKSGVDGPPMPAEEQADGSLQPPLMGPMTEQASHPLGRRYLQGGCERTR